MIFGLLALLALFAAVVWLLSRPLRAGAPAPEETVSAERASLEAAKETKYAEIRDAELDLRTGKLSQADFRALDRQLRAEAVEILRALDNAGG